MVRRITGKLLSLAAVVLFAAAMLPALSASAEEEPAFSYTLAEPIELIENYDGEMVSIWNEDDEIIGQYFKYSYSVWQDGAVMKLFGDEYVFDSQQDGFVNSSGDVLDSDFIYVRDDQSKDNVWGLGEHTVQVWCDETNQPCEFTVTVAPSPIQTLTFTPAQPYKLTEGLNMRIDWGPEADEYPIYVMPEYQDGDNLTINGEDYIYDSKESSFISSTGDKIDGDQIKKTSDQSFINRWNPGEHEMTVNYMGKETIVPVTLEAQNIQVLSFEPADRYELIENYDGYMDTEEVDGEEIEFFKYQTQGFKEGDVLTVDGDKYTYVGRIEGWGDGRYFENEKGDRILYSSELSMVGNRYSVAIHFDQSAQSPWELGEHEMTVSYCRCACTAPVWVVENPVKEVTFVPLTDVFMRGVRYYSDWPYWEEFYRPQAGDKLVINKSEEYTYNWAKNAYVSEDGRTIDADEAAVYPENFEEWTYGSLCKVVVKYMNITGTFEVTPADHTEEADEALDKARAAYLEEMEKAREMLKTNDNKQLRDAIAVADRAWGGFLSDYNSAIEYLREAEAAASGKDLSNAVVTAANQTYTGKALKPAAEVTLDGETVPADAYDVSYANNTKAGKATVKVTGKGGAYYGEASGQFTIAKAKNTMKVTPKTAIVKFAKLKKKNQTIRRTKALTVSKPAGKVTYVKSGGSRKIAIAKKTGNVTVKKGLKKGTYKVKVKVTAAGDANHKKLTKTVTFKVRVK